MAGAVRQPGHDARPVVCQGGGNFARALASAAVAWVPMNIGVLLDMQTFLYFQKMQQKIAQHPSSLRTFLLYVVPALAGTFVGATVPGLMAGVVAPLVRRDRLTLWIWFAAASGWESWRQSWEPESRTT